MDPTLQVGAQAVLNAVAATQTGSPTAADSASQQMIETASRQLFGFLLNLVMGEMGDS